MTPERLAYIELYPYWAYRDDVEWLLAERTLLRAALEDIAKETGTPYARIAQAALDAVAPEEPV